jgi:hypothetical protein
MAGLAWLPCYAQDSGLDAGQIDPLLGEWDGSWNYSTGMDGYVSTFRLVFEWKRNRLEGRFIPGEYKHIRLERKSEDSDELEEHVEVLKSVSRQGTVGKLVRTSREPPGYRWYADGYCWNVVIQGPQMSGVRNGGPCTAAGVGSGAKLNEIEARKTGTSRTPAKGSR